ncbi:DUF2017 domain-containing protein [Corynebacterium sp. 153RC1]|uniref:DUF2017 domain-containing protein n=1 Tax=unclassified Corynebacterium TaxID=2624378 RepID=UPI00211C41D5|nr:DUF2017 domain-containing protein [Corynebacterium sp. 209RC1]MCQ9355501.1 DUF2017 domain-containing protein [Corynebacterium sp. 1222RC1]MCQ9357702.1 DUF2017 domain-containing protein [Corynebacterium sp. 122RC1]MCQ9359909.1 DUF2017 domain-containing protein [Corynebacterium sp. 142RC1]MCQ9362038.1 DUF2017 domain-containing protein [Corynebacterium sp. 153RC1]MCQ9364093.1 DUF2017 domain-containing protein [Corynebacterium sp. 732RC1]MCQ9366212.1 DUF2017 domain-containing protein [Coryneba
MQAWKRKKGLMREPRYTCVLEEYERQVLGELAVTVVEALIQRVQSAPKDELAELTGMVSGHKEAPEDEGLARLLPDFEREGEEEFEGEASMLRSLHEPDICRTKIEQLTLVVNALQDGAEIVVPEQEAGAWLGALNDIRLYIAASGGDADVVEWLAFNQESLLHAMDMD